MVKVGINGFGRIGRLVFRSILERSDCECVAINDPFMDQAAVAYFLKHDTVHGKIHADVRVEGDTLFVGSKVCKIYREKQPEVIPWGDAGVEIVCECTGVFLTKESAEKHLATGAKKVIMSAPPKDDTPMFVMGVNHERYTKDITVLSNASCTTNCLAPLAKIVHEHFGIVQGLMVTVHSQTATQKTVDASAGAKDLRGGRAAGSNIIPSSTGAALAVGKVFEPLRNKLTGCAMRVPTLNVSVVVLTCVLEKPTTKEGIIEVIRKESKGAYKGIMNSTSEDVVSSDFNHDSHSSTLDEKCMLMIGDKFVQIVSWYDNEWGYSNRLVDLANYVSKK